MQPSPRVWHPASITQLQQRWSLPSPPPRQATGLQGGAEAAKTVHVLSSGLKAAATWHRTRILQDCRECCGGMGFLAANKIGPMLTDMNVDVTFEGDNTGRCGGPRGCLWGPEGSQEAARGRSAEGLVRMLGCLDGSSRGPGL